MSREHSFDLRIAHSSPLFTATPLTGNRTNGWSTLCTVNGYLCDDPVGQSAVFTTSANATMDLEFWGSRIEVRGNVTGRMELEWDLDGTTPSMGQLASQEGDNVVGLPLGSGLLAVFEGLDSSKAHRLRMTTRPALPSSMVAFEGVVVKVGTGVAGGDMLLTYLDDTNSALQYSQTPGAWAQYNEYNNTILNMTHPKDVTNQSFHCSKEPAESASMNFNGTQVLLFGPCYASNGAYTVTIDNQEAVLFNASTNAYSTPLAFSVAGSCLRYMSPQLSPNELHYVGIANADKGRETNLDWVLVVSNTGGQSISEGVRKKGSKVAAIAGAVAGAIALIIALGTLWFVLHRRRSRVKRVVARTTSRVSMDERKVASVDLLAADSNIPQMLDGRQPNVLVSPSNGSQGNARSYQRVEPFTLPPLVTPATGEARKAGSGAESSPSSASSAEPAARVIRESLSTDSPAPTMAPTDRAVEGGVTLAMSAPAPVALASQLPGPREIQANTGQSTASPASTLPHTLPQPVSHANQVGQAQPVQAPPSQSNPVPVPNLSQISSDVNRILAQLGQIRRQGESASTDQRGYTGNSYDEDVPGGAPPEYGKHRRA